MGWGAYTSLDGKVTFKSALFKPEAYALRQVVFIGR